GGNRNKTNADLILNAIRVTSHPASWVQYGRVDLEQAMLHLNPTNPPMVTGVTPTQVQAFKGGTITLTGSAFLTATAVTADGHVLVPPEFTIVNDTTITFQAPTASALGVTDVTVTNIAGTSLPNHYTYIETNPPKMDAPLTTGSHQYFTWSYGGGANDFFVLLLSTDSSTFPFHGFDVLLNYIMAYSGYLDGVGLGDLTILVPTGLTGTTFYSQIATFEPNFAGASNIATTLINN
ncbi:MAG: IPT/TIG domain-containing protein, partial [Planctomycetota bacterium]